MPRVPLGMSYPDATIDGTQTTVAAIGIYSKRAGIVAKSVFYSFHYERDVKRVQLVRNINALEGQPLLNAQKWEEVRRLGTKAIQDWIHGQMAYKAAVIVLIGQETASRPWVVYEIEKAWYDKKPLLGVWIHGLSSMGSIDRRGANPFDKAEVGTGIPVFDPTARDLRGNTDSQATYKNLVDNLEKWSGQGVIRSR
ncbi:TIR domain-containing protein [Micromonospora zamorensis]|uniref:TIR domain-containing protein n=1 Tax=Micromonospora zamorensis TaxID=709883 RepID=UPI003CF41EFE